MTRSIESVIWLSATDETVLTPEDVATAGTAIVTAYSTSRREGGKHAYF